MEDKYFTPAIEDIHVGYECEILYAHNMSEYNPKLTEDIWEKYIFEIQGVDQVDKCLVLDDEYRTPYLTKEQIEAEGWTILDTSNQWGGKPSYRETFKKGNYLVVLDTRKPHIEIIAADVTLIDFLPEFPENFRVAIPCPSINEFRTICKLLNIK